MGFIPLIRVIFKIDFLYKIKFWFLLDNLRWISILKSRGDLFLLFLGFRNCESGTRHQEKERTGKLLWKLRIIKKLFFEQKSYSANTYLRQAPRGPGVLSHESLFSSRGRLYRMKGSDFLILLEKRETLFFLPRIFV